VTGDNSGPYMPSAPQFINSNQTETEVIIPQPNKSDQEIRLDNNIPASLSSQHIQLPLFENVPLAESSK